MTEFQQNFFEVFGLQPVWELEAEDLAARYRKLQRDIHPDKFASAGDREKRIAVQFTSHVNEAYDTLKSPTRRAAYLLKLQGIEQDYNATTHTDMDFLMEQMSLREALADIRDEADPLAALDGVKGQANCLRDRLLDEFAVQYNSQDYHAGFDTVSKLHFVDKLSKDIQHLEGQLLDE